MLDAIQAGIAAVLVISLLVGAKDAALAFAVANVALACYRLLPK